MKTQSVLFSYSSLFKNGTPNQYFHIPWEKPMTSFVHDMFLTEKYAIVIDGSVRSDGARLKLGKGITFFDETKPLRFGVLPRSNASPENIKWVTTGGPGSVWHTISAWDNEDGVNIKSYECDIMPPIKIYCPLLCLLPMLSSTFL